MGLADGSLVSNLVGFPTLSCGYKLTGVVGMDVAVGKPGIRKGALMQDGGVDVADGSGACV